MEEGKDQDNLSDYENPFFRAALKIHPLLWTRRHHKAVGSSLPDSFKGRGENIPEIETLTKEEITKAMKEYTEPDIKNLLYLKSIALPWARGYFEKWLVHFGQFGQVLRYLKKDKKKLFSPEEIESFHSNWKNARKQISGLGWMNGEESK
jgi:hypothetical protein